MELITENLKNIVERYTVTAKGYGKSIEDHDYETANSSFVENEEIFHQLLKLGEKGGQALFNLLHHKNSHVRITAAKHLLNTYTSESITVLKEVSVDPGFCGLRARIALEDYRMNTSTVPKF